MGKGPRNRLKGEELRKYEETLARIRKFEKEKLSIRNDYYCADCDYAFTVDEAGWVEDAGTEMCTCPKCKTLELTEL